MDEWLSNVTESQKNYFLIEMQHLIENGVYNI